MVSSWVKPTRTNDGRAYIYIKILNSEQYYSAWGNSPIQAKIKVMRMMAWDRRNGLIPSAWDRLDLDALRSEV